MSVDLCVARNPHRILGAENNMSTTDMGYPTEAHKPVTLNVTMNNEKPCLQ
jgi:hypothetical protein